jgi:hypothetical protein
MNRWLISWRIAGAGVALGLCTVLVSTHLIASFAGRHQAGAVFAPSQASPSVWTSGIVAQTQAAGPDTIALTATPDPFGTYTFIVAVRDAQGVPLQGAAVDLVLTMPDMQMAALRIHAPPIVPPVPGTYQAQGVLAAGRWQAVVQVLAQGATHSAQATFRFTVA